MDKLVRVLKKIKIKNILILILLLIFNTYAWFTYATKVSMDMTVHVSSWNVEFSFGEEESITNMKIEVEKAYPGMETFEKVIDVHNKGETVASLRYEIKSIRIMDTTYTVSEELSSDELEKKITEEYPFKISIIKEEINSENATLIGKFIISVKWDFESGNDEEDTKWGNNAYEFCRKNPQKSFMDLDINLIASQKK